jgi:hypothetical protein
MRNEAPELLADNINTWFGKSDSSRMVRTLDGTARAFLSDRYRRIDNAEIAEATLPILSEMQDVKVESCEITDSRMYIKVVCPRIEIEVKKGDPVQAGIVISNSEVGLGSVNVQPLVYRLVCTNGMIVPDEGVRKYHVGRNNEGNEDYGIFKDDTKRADDRAFMLKLRDALTAALEVTRFEKIVNRMRSAAEMNISTHDIPHVIELTSEEWHFAEDEKRGILDHLIRGNDLSLYGLANSITRTAQDVPSYDRATELEAIGWKVIAISAQKWKQLNTEVAA